MFNTGSAEEISYDYDQLKCSNIFINISDAKRAAECWFKYFKICNTF